jgi:hypothetical protein
MPDAYTQSPRSQNSEDRLMAGVASAAVVSGELIIGLDDGRIIRAGYVQGPTGRTGPEGAIGATGQRGMDGNTILSGADKPKPDAGKEGDFWINTRDWYIYGPKTSGQWGTGTYMLGPKHYLKNSRDNQGGGGTAPSSESGGGGTGSVFSNQVFLSGTGRAITAPGGNIIPEGKNLSVQSNLNKWIENSLRALDTKLPVAVVDSLPGTGQYEGDLVLFEGKLYVWAGSDWVKVTSDGGAHVAPNPPVPAEEGRLWFSNDETDLTLYIYDGAVWVPASPPVSLDGINTTIAGIDEELMTINRNVAINKSEVDEQLFDFQKDQQRQDERLDALESNSGGDDFLPTAGGELKGTLQINGSMDNKIDPLLCRADGYYMTFGVTKTGEVLAGTAPALPFMAVDGWHVVTKGYLDSRVPEQGLFHETWWTFRADADRSDCDKGEFCADDGDFFMSDKNEDNHSWGPSIAGGRSTQMFVTIYSSEGKLCHTYEVNKIHFHEKYTKKYVTEFDWTWSHVSNALVDGAKYKIVVPGFLT